MTLGDGRQDRRPGSSRAGRAADARRRRVGVIAVGVVGLALVVALVLRAFGGDGTAPGAPGSSGPDDRAPSELAILSVTGAPKALVAVVGAGGSQSPAALILPPDTTVVAPGQGEATSEAVQALPGDSMRVAVSNAVGAWAPGYGVIDLAGLATAVDRAGGLRVEMPDPVTVDEVVLGPGATTMTGAQVAAYLADAGDDTVVRWMAVLDSLLAARVLEADDFLEADDAEGTVALLGEAAGASADLVPTQVVAGATAIPSQPDLDLLMGERFATPTPVHVVVQNGSGEAGVGEAVAARIIPEGFRVVLSQNAESFHYDVTEITATGDEHVDDAETIRDALGVGTVQVTQVPSGLADVLIVVGKDFTA